jgi:GTP-binding protein EngB required for normal cell division
MTNNDTTSSEKKKFAMKKKPTARLSLDTQTLEQKQKDMRDFISQKVKESSVILKESYSRNLMFVGKTKNGKSTTFCTLKSPFTFVEVGNVFSQTRDAEIHHFTVEVDLEDQQANFNISIIDTPGLFEVTMDNSARDNDALEEIVLKCMKAEITKIHAIFFVVAYNGAVNIQDIEALERFIKLFGGAENHINILITKCEKLSQTDKEKIVKDFQNYPQMKDLLKKVGQQIYFTGAVENIDFEKGFVDTFKYNLNNVIEMRDEMFNFIFQQENAFELNALHMVDKVRANADALLKKVESLFENKDSIDNIQILNDDCVKLRSWLPVLDAANHAKAKTLLNECGTFVNDFKKTCTITNLNKERCWIKFQIKRLNHIKCFFESSCCHLIVV